MRSATVCALLALGCNAFDESLIPSDTGSTTSGLGEDCLGRDIPNFESLNEFRVIDTSELRNDRYQLSCVGSALGNDGFFAVQMTEGKKWHFHVKVTPGTMADPAVYVLDSGCQDSVCQPGWGLNECLVGQDEHFSFFPPHDGTYLVGVDTMAEGGDAMQVLAVEPECGNGNKEHSETCDDGNTEPGDGCDAFCRAELENAASETEPNDEPTANANVLMSSSGSLRVNGQVGSKCDFDSYSLDVVENGSVRAILSGLGDQECDIDLRLQLLGPDGLAPIGTVESAAGVCPVIEGTESFASELAAGTYFVRVAPQRQDEPSALDYSLEVELPPPP